MLTANCMGIRLLLASLQRRCVGPLSTLADDTACSQQRHFAISWRRELQKAVDTVENGLITISESLPLASQQGGSERTTLTPRELVEHLDRNIVGQEDAKKAVANALRNRWRRSQLDGQLKSEIVPKNILMIGPTGCGKTEIARRMAKIADAPFVKVEATKFTETGFHGRDVDQIIRDLMDNALALTKRRLHEKNRQQIDQAVEDAILRELCGPEANERTIEAFREQLRMKRLEDRQIELDTPGSKVNMDLPGLPQGLVFQLRNVGEMFGEGMQTNRKQSERRQMSVAEARPVLEKAEEEKLTESPSVVRDALHSAEQEGIVFIDEIDKIVSPSGSKLGGPDASAEGVQRDLLPIIEGSVVNTNYGNVNTDHILFICSGAFHQCQPKDMLAELQGRLPVRVELKGLTADDFYRILTEPDYNLIKQQRELLRTEGIHLEFEDEAIREIASMAAQVNQQVDNIGARRLHTVIERIIEDISFSAPDKAKEAMAEGTSPLQFVVDKQLVQQRVGKLLKRQNLSKFIL